MALLCYLQPFDKGFLDLNRPLSKHVPPAVTASVNTELGRHTESKSRRSECTKISQEEKAKVAKYATENGVAKALKLLFSRNGHDSVNHAHNLNVCIFTEWKSLENFVLHMY